MLCVPKKYKVIRLDCSEQPDTCSVYRAVLNSQDGLNDDDYEKNHTMDITSVINENRSLIKQGRCINEDAYTPPPPPTNSPVEPEVPLSVVSSSKKIILAGNNQTGKTSLLKAFLREPWQESYESTSLVTESVAIYLRNKMMEFLITDPGGNMNRFDSLISFIYPKADLILLCFAINDYESLNSVTDYWQKILNRFCPKAPILLVGTKMDLRPENADGTSNPFDMVFPGAGTNMAEKIGAICYLECSAKEDININGLLKAMATVFVFGGKNDYKKKTRMFSLMMNKWCSII